MVQVRKNLRLANIIEQGIAIEATQGAANAWVFLTFNQVPRRVVARILAKSARRRSTDAAAAKISIELSEEVETV